MSTDKSMSAPVMKINLRKTAPDQMTVTNLKQQLTAIGLNCADADESKLQAYITDVRSQLPHGSLQGYFIGRLNQSSNNFEWSSLANWEPVDEAPSRSGELKFLCRRDRFDWISQNNSGFIGKYGQDADSDAYYDTVAAVKQAFIDAAEASSSSLVKGLNKADMESALSNLLLNIDNGNSSNFDSGLRETCFLIVDNYRIEGDNQVIDGAGFVGVQWHLQINDYKKKKQNLQHHSVIHVSSWSAVYSQWDDIDRDVRFVAHGRNESIPDIPF